MESKSGGSRVGACIVLAVLALIAQIACGFIYTLLFTLSSLLTFLPDFLVYVLAYAFYPLVLGILCVPLVHFLPWAADCSERICPTRKGLRYICIVIYDVLCVISNVLPCILGRASFSFYYLLPLIYAAVFLYIKSSVPHVPSSSSVKEPSIDEKVSAAVDELKKLCPASCWDIISIPVLESVKKDANDMISFFKNNPTVTPTAWTISALFTECGDQLSSGRHHFYRGELNRTGIEIRKVYNFLGEELVRRQIADQDYVDSDKRIVSNNIRDVG
nr:MAG TPA: hypothetical protein [Caudoviricetes sp.]